MVEFLVNYWVDIALVAIVLAVVAYVVYLFYTKQLDKVREWLLYFVIQAEAYLGSGTGKLKLRYVYDAFVQKYPILKVFVSFDKFSKMVDVALDEMERMIETNDKVKKIVTKREVI